MSGVERIEGRRARRAFWLALSDPVVAVAAALGEALTVVGCAIASGVVYHLVVYGDSGRVGSFTAVGLLAGLLYIVPFLGQGEHGTEAFLSGRRSSRRIIQRWCAAVLLLAMVGFLTKSTGSFSRGWIALFVVFAPLVLLRAESVAAYVVGLGLKSGTMTPRRLMVVGTIEDLEAFWAQRAPREDGYRAVAVARLDPGDDGESQRAIERAVDEARALEVDCILLLSGVNRQRLLGQCLEAFAELPACVRLDAKAFAGLTAGRRLERVGNVGAVALLDRPLRPQAAAMKRAFDIVAAGAGLLALSPLFAVIAVMIKLDSKGPVFFRQRRRGYNQCEFRIYKFRTMTSLDDGEVVVQARRDDPRVTRVGKFLRRWNLDELPQLLNVLAGEMSVVGPRPHAVAHDRLFETRIAGYSRRLGVRPGMTGWAQVNGLRGETDTDEKMRQRVAFDLHYIDNWSLAFDLYIILLTVSSPRAFANAH